MPFFRLVYTPTYLHQSDQYIAKCCCILPWRVFQVRNYWTAALWAMKYLWNFIYYLCSVPFPFTHVVSKSLFACSERHHLRNPAASV